MEQGKKVIIGIVAATLILLFGGVFLISSKQKPVEQAISNLSTEEAWTKGAVNPSVVLVGFGDFQCPACAGYEPVINQLLKENPAKLQIAWRHFPLTGHKNSQPAAAAAEAAGKQGKFWEMHDKLFATQTAWSEADNAPEIFAGYAQELGLDKEKFNQDIKSEEVAGKVQRDLALGTQLQIQGTPTFFANGQKINLTGGPESFKNAVKEIISKTPVKDQAEYKAVAKLKVILDKQEVDFSQGKYQSSASARLNENIYMEGGNGTDLIVKNQIATLNDFFKSLKISFTSDCLELDSGEKFCNSGQKSLKMYINGQVSGTYQNYAPVNGDKILITYGDETVAEVQKQIDSMKKGE